MMRSLISIRLTKYNLLVCHKIHFSFVYLILHNRTMFALYSAAILATTAQTKAYSNYTNNENIIDIHRKETYHATGAIVQLFEWSWEDVANECETFLRYIYIYVYIYYGYMYIYM